MFDLIFLVVSDKQAESRSYFYYAFGEAGFTAHFPKVC